MIAHNSNKTSPLIIDDLLDDIAISLEAFCSLAPPLPAEIKINAAINVVVEGDAGKNKFLPPMHLIKIIINCVMLRSMTRPCQYCFLI
jgi:hypothetical protein